MNTQGLKIQPRVPPEGPWEGLQRVPGRVSGGSLGGSPEGPWEGLRRVSGRVSGALRVPKSIVNSSHTGQAPEYCRLRVLVYNILGLDPLEQYCRLRLLVYNMLGLDPLTEYCRLRPLVYNILVRVR